RLSLPPVLVLLPRTANVRRGHRDTGTGIDTLDPFGHAGGQGRRDLLSPLTRHDHDDLVVQKHVEIAVKAAVAQQAEANLEADGRQGRDACRQERRGAEILWPVRSTV